MNCRTCQAVLFCLIFQTKSFADKTVSLQCNKSFQNYFLIWNPITVNWNGELHNTQQTDIYSVILAILNRQKIIEHGADDSEGDDDEDDE